MATSNSDSIAERVRFWEEQDKINQELIPRVIRQNELLTKHIAEHDNLPEVAGNAISQALAEGRMEQRQQYEAALDGARTELAEQAQANFQKALENFRAALSEAKAELSEQTQTSLCPSVGAPAVGYGSPQKRIERTDPDQRDRGTGDLARRIPHDTKRAHRHNCRGWGGLHCHADRGLIT